MARPPKMNGRTHPLKVDYAELKRAMENLVRPSPLVRFERRQRWERQAAAAATVQRAQFWKDDFMQKMEIVHKSKASHFLDAVSLEIRRRRLRIRDVFRDVDVGRLGRLGE